MLRSSVPSYYLTEPDEVVFCLEDPVDDADLSAVKEFSAPFRQFARTKIVTVLKNPEYSSQIAWKRREGFLAASNDRILSVDPDLSVNRNVHEALAQVGRRNIGYASCTTVYPVTGIVRFFQALVHLLASRLRPPPLTGLYALWRPYWMDSEDEGIKSHLESLESEVHGSKVVIGEDTYLLNCMKRKHRAVHLRKIGAYSMKPYHTSARHVQYELGRYHAAKHDSPWKVFLISVALLQPHRMLGYVHQRGNGSEVPTFNPETYPF